MQRNKLTKLKLYIKNKSLHWKLLISVAVAICAMMISLFCIVYLNLLRMKSLGNSYKSNTELDSFSNQIAQTEKSLEDYVKYHTFESIDSYYSISKKVEESIQIMQNFPSKNLIKQKEYIVNQFTQSFIHFGNKTVAARRSNNLQETNFYYSKSLECYNYLQSQLLELNKLRLQENAITYNQNSKKISTVSTFSVIFFIAFSLFIFIFLYFTIKKITSPLQEISEVAHQVATRNFDVPLFNKTTTDEIGNICQAFDKMIISIREYIDTIWEKAHTEATLKEKEIKMQALYTDAQLRALQNQVNPHFLFNTLNTGAQLAMMEGADKTSYFIEQVADFFRYNIQHQTQTVSINEELGLVENFVYIMKVRFGNRLQFDKIIPETNLDIQMPIMTLQPLVENCIKHGLKNSTGIVQLEVKELSNYIEISVCDNGTGIEDNIKKEVFNAVAAGNTKLENYHSASNGTGLISVFLRLKMYFHRDDIFDIVDNIDSTDATKKVGTKFIIRIPKNV